MALQNERLTTLTSFSANAAHELATPLGTIGLAAKELAAHVALGCSPDVVLADTTLICAEVARCRKILADISARAGESVGEMPTRTTPEEILRHVDRSLAREHAARLAIRFESEAAAAATVVVPKDTLAQMITNLIKNAVEAHDERQVESPVELSVAVADRLAFHVRDRGAGLPDRVQQRLGEPFVTTKGQAGGLGLGVYLARRFAERLGGTLRYSSRAGGGLEAELALPLDTIGSRP